MKEEDRKKLNELFGDLFFTAGGWRLNEPTMLKLLFQGHSREEAIAKSCGCICFCPVCKDPLNDQATWSDPNDTGLGTYTCSKCSHVSNWNFVAFPFPVLVKE